MYIYTSLSLSLSISIYTHIYVYIYIYIYESRGQPLSRAPCWEGPKPGIRRGVQ